MTGRAFIQEDEKNRYHDIMMAHGGKMIFIRFNPDLKGTSLESKLSVLVEEMHKHMEHIDRGENSELLEVVYLFYPGLEPTRARRGGKTPTQ
jgi:hypothetical protein